MGKGPARSEALELAWRERLARQERSGLTARDFCRNENLKESAFFYWRRELARRDAKRQSSGHEPKARRKKRDSSPFLPITVSPTTPAPIEIALPGSVSIRVSGGCDESLLKMVVDVLSKTCGGEEQR